MSLLENPAPHGGLRRSLYATALSGVPMLVDSVGRPVTDIRISVTKRCNFACIYCHDEGLGPVAGPRSAHGDEMTPREIERIVAVAREFEIRSVKFTGGEPLVRPDLEEIVARTVRHVADVSLTTNGSMLEGRAEALRDAGLKRVNVSVRRGRIRGPRLVVDLAHLRPAFDLLEPDVWAAAIAQARRELPAAAAPGTAPATIVEREVVKIRCRYCGTLGSEGEARCPYCGASL